VRRLLREKFNLDEFRPLQLSAINAVMCDEDVLLITSTGAEAANSALPAKMEEWLRA
jgi:Lhr-like helicase